MSDSEECPKLWLLEKKSGITPCPEVIRAVGCDVLQTTARRVSSEETHPPHLKSLSSTESHCSAGSALSGASISEVGQCRAMQGSVFRAWHLAVIISTIIQIYYLYVNSPQLIWRSDTRRWNLRVSDPQMSCADLTTRQGSYMIAPAMVGYQAPCHIYPLRCRIDICLVEIWK